MKIHVIFHERRDKEIAVIVAFLQSKQPRLPLGSHRRGEGFSAKQIPELVVRSSVYQDWPVKT